ncbi:MAG TPA: helix-turn-helix domain-containing protein [Gemmatimonadaceae bacterium]|nr:helix-turn-helix domain-containing protein [Gemmatimonadaceae bacterium]
MAGVVKLDPRPALAPFVAGIHYLESDCASDGPALERILPSARVHLLVNLREDEIRTYHGDDCATVRRSRGAVLEGAASRARVIDTGAQRCLMSVDFTLGGAAAFLGIPLDEARDELVELDQLWGCDGAALRERLLEAASAADKLRVVESLLFRRLRKRDEPDVALRCAAALLARGVSVSEAASRVGLLPRTLARRFRATVGLSPKRYSRVRRLQRVVRSIGDAQSADWCDLAATHGYVDQAHLIHDFRALAGMTPTAYRPRSPGEHNHVPVAQG